MAYEPHDVIKPDTIAQTMVTGLAEKLVITNTFTRFAAEEYLGRPGNKITMRIPGTLPFREWEFRNDRREPLRVDSLTETTVDMTVDAKWIYSAVELTPEQKQFDFGGSWGDLFNKQTEALARGIEFDAMSQIVNAPYELVGGIDVDPAKVAAQATMGRDYLFNQFLDLRTALRRMRVPDENFQIIAGANFVAELRKSGKLYDAKVQGRGAFADASVGNYAGFEIVEGPYTLDPNVAYLYGPSAFLFWNAAPPAQDGAVRQGNAAVDGLSMRWFQDYDAAYVIDRSIYMAWKSWNTTKDFLSLESATGQLFTSEDQYFLRGIKLLLHTGEGDAPVGSFGGSTIPKLADVQSQFRHPGDGNSETPGGAADSFLAKAWNGEIAEGKVDAGLFMPPHLRAGAETQNTTPVVDDGNVAPAPVKTESKTK